MLTRVEVSGVQAVAAIEPARPAGDARQEGFHRFAQIAIGQRLTGEVISRFDDGGFLVKIADTAAHMMLPARTQIGDSLQLTLVSREPQATFFLAAQTETPTTSLSPTARLIGQLLQTAQQHAAPTAIVGKTPLITSSTTNTALIAAALKEKISLSGLFYESHIVEWADGKRSLTDLLREPQAQVNVSGTDSKGTSKPDAVTPELAQIINLQLETLEKHRVIWQGEAWPGQLMEWEVSENPEDKNTAREAHQSWQSSVRFNLPVLGHVSANLHLLGDRLQISIRASSEAATSSLRTHAAQLAEALDGTGSTLESLTVKLDEQA